MIRCVPAEPPNSALEEAFITVWRQALLDRAEVVLLHGQTYAVRRTAKRGLAQVDFQVDGLSFRALQQNPQTSSRWAQLARKGAKVMQFLSNRSYVGVVVDGHFTRYPPRKS